MNGMQKGSMKSDKMDRQSALCALCIHWQCHLQSTALILQHRKFQNRFVPVICCLLYHEITSILLRYPVTYRPCARIARSHLKPSSIPFTLCDCCFLAMHLRRSHLFTILFHNPFHFNVIQIHGVVHAFTNAFRPLYYSLRHVNATDPIHTLLHSIMCCRCCESFKRKMLCIARKFNDLFAFHFLSLSKQQKRKMAQKRE